MTSFALLVQAELVKLLSRTSARVGLVAAFLLGITPPLLGFLFTQSGLIVQGVEASEAGILGTTPLIIALYLRNLPVAMRAFVIVLAAQSLAGELGDRTLRENLLRPVRRDAVFAAKWLALIGWDVLALACTFSGGAAIALIAFGTAGPWLAVLLAFALTVLCDAALIAVVLAIGAISRSLIVTLVGTLAFLVIDKSLSLALPLASFGAQWFTTSETIVNLINAWPILPSAGLAVWTFVLPNADFYWASIGSLAFLLVAGPLVSLVALRRLDLP